MQPPALIRAHLAPPAFDDGAPPVQAGEFREAMSLLGAAVSVVTTDGPAGMAGFTASAVCSVTDEPPTLLVCVNRRAYTHGLLVKNGVLCVNVLTASQQDLSDLFANRSASMHERFAAAPWQVLHTGAPALEGALVNLDAEIVRRHEVGTHSVFYAELRRIRLAGQGDAGLAYFARGYHRLVRAS